MLEAIAIFLQFIDVFLGVNQNARDTKKSEVAKWAYILHSKLKKISNIVSDMLEVLEGLKSEESRYSPVFRNNSKLNLMVVRQIDYISRYALVDLLSLNEKGEKYVVEKSRKISLIKLLQLSLSTHIQEFCEEIQDLIFFMYPQGIRNFYSKHHHMLDSLKVFDENLHEDIHAAAMYDFGFLDLLAKLGIQFEKKQNTIHIAKAKFELHRDLDEYGFYFERTTTDYNLDNPDEVEKLLDAIKNLRSVIDSASENVRNFIIKNYSIEDII